MRDFGNIWRSVKPSLTLLPAADVARIQSTSLRISPLFALIAAAAPVSASAGNFATVWTFGAGADGRSPSAGFLAQGSSLFTTTPRGGKYGAGAVVKIQPGMGTESVLHSFNSSKDGENSTATLIAIGGKFYGTTETGGADGDGTVFSVDNTTGRSKTLHSFTGGTDGASPIDGVVANKGTLYGTTFSNSADGSGYGTVFGVDSKTGSNKTLYAFKGQGDGGYPSGGVIDDHGLLYGTAEIGGANKSGVIFSIDPSTGIEKILHNFDGKTEGGAPLGGLIAVRGVLYGTTSVGGAYSAGTVFKFDIATGVLSTLWVFGQGFDAESPIATLTYHAGVLYGTAQFGGDSSKGAVFAVDIGKKTEKVLHSFDNDDGAYPTGPLLYAGNTLYGTTFQGGQLGYGTAFSINLP